MEDRLDSTDKGGFTQHKQKPLGKNEMEDILNGKHICHGTLGCPFTNYWIKKGIELEKAGYEQGKKDEREIVKKALRKMNRYGCSWSISSETAKKFINSLEELSK